MNIMAIPVRIIIAGVNTLNLFTKTIIATGTSENTNEFTTVPMDPDSIGIILNP